MKKSFILLSSIMLLSGCVETVALLGPASSVIGGGNIAQSSISSAISYGVKQQTGKSPMQHALAYADENNPNKKKDRCISFVKKSESEICYIAKKQISSVKKSAAKKIKNVIVPSKYKLAKKIKAEKDLAFQVKDKKVTPKKTKILISQSELKVTKKIKVKQEPKLISVESMLVESALSKKQISHLRVSIEKKSRIKNSR